MGESCRHIEQRAFLDECTVHVDDTHADPCKACCVPGLCLMLAMCFTWYGGCTDPAFSASTANMLSVCYLLMPSDCCQLGTVRAQSIDPVRYDVPLFCAAVTAIIVSGQLILGGSAVITALTGKGCTCSMHELHVASLPLHKLCVMSTCRLHKS